MPKKAKGGPRDSVLSVRIPARLRHGVDLVARLNHEPLTDVIVRALDNAMALDCVRFVEQTGAASPLALLAQVWDEQESVRLVKLAFVCPMLLSGKERMVWARIRQDQRYWAHTDSPDSRTLDDLRPDRLETDWAMLSAQA